MMLEDCLPKSLLRIVGMPGTDSLKHLRPVLAAADAHSTIVERFADDELRRLVDIVPSAEAREDRHARLLRALAVAKEGCRRSLCFQPYEEQLLGCCALVEGNVIEMDTGEGKTLVGTLAATVLALLGRWVHVLSTNDYLAMRDAEWMAPLFDLLGIRSSWIGQQNVVGGTTRMLCEKRSYMRLSARWGMTCFETPIRIL